MIIENGTIEMKLKGGGGIDPMTGHPRKTLNAAWGAPIPCQYIANRHNNLGRVNGEHFTTAEYSVLIEEQPIVDIGQLRLKDRAGKIIGEFSVIQVEPLEAVSEIRILI